MEKEKLKPRKPNLTFYQYLGLLKLEINYFCKVKDCWNIKEENSLYFRDLMYEKKKQSQNKT